MILNIVIYSGVYIIIEGGLMRRGYIFLVFLLTFLNVYGNEKDRLAVMDVIDGDSLFNQKTDEKITDYIFDKFQETGLYWMIPKSDRDSALDQAIDITKKESRRECVDEKCQLSLVAELQANYLINSEIKLLVKGTCQISIRKFDVEKRAGTEAWQSKFNCTEGGIYQAVDSLKFGMKRKEDSPFKIGKMGVLDEEWNPDMAGTGEQAIIYFESEPSGALVLIDGSVAGQTPDFKSRMLASGKHQIIMEKEGFYSEMKILEIKKGDRIKFTLFPAITINTDPEGAIVRLDGDLICQSTPCKKVVEEGDREFVVQKELYTTKKEIISIQKGKDVSINLEPDFGWLQIKSSFDNIEVFVDDKSIGKTPLDSIKLSPGPHIVDTRGDCFNSVAEQLVINKNEKHIVNLSVQKKEGAIQVNAKDEKGNDLEAAIVVDGENIGTSPGIFKVGICSKEVVVKYKDSEFKKALTVQEKTVQSINAVIRQGSEMVLISAGWFWMGCSSFDNRCDYDEKPRHKVFVDKFKIDKREVTVKEYSSCVSDGKCSVPGSGEQCSYYSNDDDLPINCVNWFQADAFCKWKGKRLPTDAEWEKAARGGTETVYSCGDESFCLDDIAWYAKNSDNKLHPVGTKEPNGYGLFDMLGNVWEWVHDWYNVNYYEQSSENNPEGPDSGSTRILRGGGALGWLSDEEYLRSSYKCHTSPANGWEHDGFRCAQ